MAMNYKDVQNIDWKYGVVYFLIIETTNLFDPLILSHEYLLVYISRIIYIVIFGWNLR